MVKPKFRRLLFQYSSKTDNKMHKRKIKTLLFANIKILFCIKNIAQKKINYKNINGFFFLSRYMNNKTFLF